MKESFATYICLTIFWLECIFETEKKGKLFTKIKFKNYELWVGADICMILV